MSMCVTVPAFDESSQPSSPHRPSKLQDLYQQVNFYLDTLSSKVTSVKEKNQAEFIQAFKNYMEKIKRDLQILKQKSLEMEKYYKENDRIQGLEKQLSWFREESLKLYAKVEQKNRDVYELKFRIDELNKDKEFLESQVKQLMKKNRQFEVIVKTQPDNNEKTESQLFCTSLKPKVKLKPDWQASVHSKFISEILKQDQDPLNEMVNYVKNVENQLTKQLNTTKNRLNTILGQVTRNTCQRSELEEFFVDCIETIRKQVLKRRNLDGEYKQYDIFRIEDKQKIMELLLTNEKILQLVYNKIFPPQFNLDQHLPTQIDTETRDAKELIDKRRSLSTKDKVVIRKGKLSLYK